MDMSTSRKIPATLSFLFFMTILTGLLYPALVTAVAQLAFPARANGSLVSLNGRVVGSGLLAQKFESARFFRPRPSASDFAYVGAGPSNLGPTSAALSKAVAERRAAFSSDFGLPPAAVPEDMLYASASGLDPDISPEAALAQAGAVAAARNLGEDGKRALVEAIEGLAEASTTVLGPPRVNIVSLNVLLETDPRFADKGR
jgi:potassium-transporting ATPase KdpC subunit